jgi:putative membrane protein
MPPGRTSRTAIAIDDAVAGSAPASNPPLQGRWLFIRGDAMRLLLVWLINAVALIALPYLMSSIQVDSFTTALIAALVLGLINTFIRPVLVLLTLPATVLTLGLFIFVINGLLFWFVGSFVQGFHVAGFWSAVGGAILYSIISWALSALILHGKK